MFALAYRKRGGANRVTADSHRRYFLPRVKIENYNIDIDERKFYDQQINELWCNMMKSEKYQQRMTMITLQDVC